jgi:hypothetical protein
MTDKFSSKDEELISLRPATAVSSPSTSSEKLTPTEPLLLRLNEKQLAARWDVSVRTLQAARVNGSGVPFVRIGRSVRYRMEDVLAYEQRRLRTSTSDNS